MKKMLAVLIMLGVMFAPAAMAASPWMDSKTYSEKTMGKLSFGFKNLFLGWTEIFYQPHVASTEGKNAWGGLGKGLGYFVADTLGGAVHLVTFLVPVDVPLPDNGVNYTK